MTNDKRRNEILQLINRFFKDFDELFNFADQLDEPDKIIKLIKNATDDKLAIQLVFRLAYLDESHLAKLIMETDDEIIKQFSIFILKDENALKRVAEADTSIWTALGAVSKISDQNLLFELANNINAFSSVRWEALRRIDKTELLVKLLDNPIDDIWVKAILTKIKDMDTLLMLRLTLADRYQSELIKKIKRISEN